MSAVGVFRAPETIAKFALLCIITIPATPGVSSCESDRAPDDDGDGDRPTGRPVEIVAAAVTLYCYMLIIIVLGARQQHNIRTHCREIERERVIKRTRER